MLESFAVVVFIGHVLGDFYFQSEELSEKKNNSEMALILHCVTYLIVVMTVGWIICGNKALLYLLFMGIVHLIVDVVKHLEIKMCHNYERKELNYFLNDQVLHIISIVAVLLYMHIAEVTLSYNRCIFVDRIFDLNLNVNGILAFALYILLLIKPSNIIIHKVMNRYILREENMQEQIGRKIGVLERLLIAISLIMNQYMFIGFILIAKSVVMYEKLKKKETYSERYILGTFLSFFLAIIFYMAIFKIKYFIIR